MIPEQWFETTGRSLVNTLIRELLAEKRTGTVSVQSVMVTMHSSNKALREQTTNWERLKCKQDWMQQRSK